MKFIEMRDFKVHSAYEFFKNSEYKDILKQLLVQEKIQTDDTTEQVSTLIDLYGSDFDLIISAMERKFPDGKYFTTVDFIEDARRCEEYFQIRAWRLEKEAHERKAWCCWTLSKSEIHEVAEKIGYTPDTFSESEYEEIAERFSNWLGHSEADFWEEWLENAIREVRTH